jgi:hypothetical protein
MDHEELVNRRVYAIAQAHSRTIEDVHKALDRHPVQLDRDAYLRRTLALELMRLDQLEMAFAGKALEDQDVASGMLLVKVAERRATLLGLNAPIGHAVAVVAAPPANQRSTDAMERPLARILALRQQGGTPAEPAAPTANGQDDPTSKH